MSKLYIRLLTISAVTIAVVGGSFSVVGLAQLFAGASLAVATMAAALELAKLVVTGFLYRYWGHLHRPIRVYLSFAVATLVLITSVGIYGFLASAYQASSIGLKTQAMKIDSLVRERGELEARIAEMNGFIEAIPATRISKKFEFRRAYEPEISRLRARGDELLATIDREKAALLRTHVEVGPAVYLAEALGADLDTVVRGLILLFVLVFDPLAVCLVLCLNLAIRLREKYRGNEARIGSYAIASPVDHRFKAHRDRDSRGGKRAA